MKKLIYAGILAASMGVVAWQDAGAAGRLPSRSELLSEAHQENVPGLLNRLLNSGNLAATGDPDSYGRTANFIGLASSGLVLLSTDCTPDPTAPLGPDDRCFVVTPTPNVPQNFQAVDIGRVTLPANSAHSLICPLLTATVAYDLVNNTAAPTLAVFRVRPSLTVQSTVLSDPRAVDPTTHLPYNGEISFPIGTNSVATTIQPGAVEFRNLNYSRNCIGGISKQVLIQNFGLPTDLAEKFFRQPVTLLLNTDVSRVQMADFGDVIISIRLLGD